MALTKDQIVDQISNQRGSGRKQAISIAETLLEIIKLTLISDEDVVVSGFGKFCLKEKKERRGRNPATSEDIILPARQIVTFKCSGKLREKIIGG